MSESLKVSGLQMLVTNDVAHNESRIVRGVEQASAQGSQFLVTPEGALSGYYAAFYPWKLWQMGAQVIFHAVNSGHHQRNRAFHESSVKLWAHALQIPIFEANALSTPDEPINARSGLVSPDGSYSPHVPDVGEQFFTCEIIIPHRDPCQGRDSRGDLPQRIRDCGKLEGED